MFDAIKYEYVVAVYFFYLQAPAAAAAGATAPGGQSQSVSAVSFAVSDSWLYKKYGPSVCWKRILNRFPSTGSSKTTTVNSSAGGS